MANGRRGGPNRRATSCTPIRRSQGWHLRQHRQYRRRRGHQWSFHTSAAAGPGGVLILTTTLLTVLTVCSVVARIRMTLFPARPSERNVDAEYPQERLRATQAANQRGFSKQALTNAQIRAVRAFLCRRRRARSAIRSQGPMRRPSSSPKATRR
jgi:hypothetical protein